MILLVDTNIFLDVLYNRDGLVDTSSAFLLKSHINHDKIYISAATLKDIAYFLKKTLHDDSLVQKELVKIYSNISKVISSTADDVINSFYEDGDFEDNVQINSAIRTMCDAIITRNIKDYKNKGINCLTPEEYLKYCS